MYSYNYCPVCGDKLDQDKIDGHVRKHCKHCDFVHYINPKPSVGIIALKDRKIVLIKRGVDPGKGNWSLPSGFVETGETAEEACLRELKEETGLSGDIVQLLGVYTEDARIYGPVMVIMYLVDNLKGEMKASDDAVDAKFVDIDKVSDLHFECFNKALKYTLNILEKDKKNDMTG
ncbi:MAG: NUDIX domain-containing protein [Halanaerobiales bacterium]